MASPELQAKIDEWLKWDQNPKTKDEIQALADKGDYETLKKILLGRIKFGTAGLRGVMAAGYTCMNDLVIVQTAQGFVKYLAKTDSAKLKSSGIVVGYDSRYNSKKWAEITATVFINAGFPVRLFSVYAITPFVPFSVNLYKCVAGVVVTASHNPKNDNGYKVYGWNGCQIIPPVDQYISDSIIANLEPMASSWDTSILSGNSLLSDPQIETTAAYVKMIETMLIPEHVANNANTPLKFTYTAMHGVGYPIACKVFEIANIKLIPVKEQIDPDPEFTTVKFPNPEEGKSSLELSFKTANENGSTIIIANDPDADRLGVAEKTGDKWKIFTGNELGALLAWWMYTCFVKKNPQTPMSDIYMISSAVSSKICRSIAQKHGFNFVETLTGKIAFNTFAPNCENKLSKYL